MPFVSFDPREALRTQITTVADLFSNGTDERIITITDAAGNDYKIPIYLVEESKSDELKPLPMIELGILNNKSTVQDISASTRKHEAIIDMIISWQKSDDVEQNKFGKLIADKLSDLIRINQCGTVSGTHFITIIDGGRIRPEVHGRQVIYHINMEIYALWYDKP